MLLNQIYHSEIPLFLREFSATDALLRLKSIGMDCGCEYTNFPAYKNSIKYNRYEHSLGTALIIWHFSMDMKQSVAGLLHDISTPVFSHSIDFLNNDYLLQESTEEDTEKIIYQSGQLMQLLKKYAISLEEVCNYHIYPIACLLYTSERFPRLQERTRQLAGTLSGGEQQMLAMGRALMAQPRIILMDEPSMGLSPLFVNEIFNIITEVNKQGVTILLVEQNAKKALSIANRAYVLETGRIVNEGDAHALLDDESIDVYKRQVDDHIGTVHFHISPHLIHIGDIHLIPVRQKHIQLRSIQHPCKCAAHLSLGPCNPNPFML